MAPQDDLTAERAAFQLIWHISQELGILKSFTVEDFEREDVYPLCRGHIIKALKTARQEALREAAKVQCVWCNDQENWAPMSNSGYHVHNQPGRSKTRCDATAIWDHISQLDRLASEGG